MSEVIIDELQNVLTLLIDEQFWCKRSLAQDKNGEPIFDPWSENCCKWCITGALYALDASSETVDYLKKMSKLFGYNDLERLNDLNEHFFVIQFLQYCLNNLGGYFYLKHPLKYLKMKGILK